MLIPASGSATAATSLAQRALPNAPDGYAPGNVECPDQKNLVRSASNGIADGEDEFIKKRHDVTDEALKTLFARLDISGFDADAFLASYSPTVSVAFSGGGYRAMLAGAGSLKAIDARTPGTDGEGQLGGLLQASTYLAGLSGGSWLVGSMIVNNYTTIGDLQASKDIWNFEHAIYAPEGKLKIFSTIDYFKELRDEVLTKKESGFDVSITDYWSRALSRQFFDAPKGGLSLTWSSIADTDQYQNAEHPFPIVVADGRYQGETLIAENATVYEFTPLEFGSFDPQLHAFTPLKYIGTNVTAGVPDNKTCVAGFDNAGFVVGTSSSLFNQLIFQVDSTDLLDPIRKVAESVLGTLADAEADIADYSPNPFYGINPDTNPNAKHRDLTLVDGGEDLQNLPLHPLIQPVRKVDVIFAFDESGDTLTTDGTMTSWPNGTALVASYERSLNPDISNGTNFPAVPGQNTFVNLGLNNHPVFFGCDAKNFTGHIPPLLVYIPNSPWSYNSNTSTTQMSYEDDERDAMIGNGWNVATQGNSTDWAVCVGCAVLHRELERTGADVPEPCTACMEEYCWTGEISGDTPTENYEPKLKAEKSAGRVRRSVEFGVVMGVVGVVAVVVGL